MNWKPSRGRDGWWRLVDLFGRVGPGKFRYRGQAQAVADKLNGGMA